MIDGFLIVGEDIGKYGTALLNFDLWQNIRVKQERNLDSELRGMVGYTARIFSFTSQK